MSSGSRRLTLDEMPALAPGMTTWHITFGTYGARLHGGVRPTVSRAANQPGDPFIEAHQPREEHERRAARGPAVMLSVAQCEFIEGTMPALSERGGWVLRTCSASPPRPPGVDGDHVHVLVDAPSHIQGKPVRALIKRWLTQALDARWGKPESGSWWAEGGSNKPVGDDEYRLNAHNYIVRQRATRE